MLLNDEQLRQLIKKGLIRDYIDLEKQLTPQSFDLTIESIHDFAGKGRVDFSNKNRKIPETKKIEWQNKKISLGKGHYKIRANEYISMPDNLVGVARPRSSLLRCGCTVDTGIWDAGFKGNSEFLLIVGQEGLDLEKNARIISVMFFQVDKVKNAYSGIYTS